MFHPMFDMELPSNKFIFGGGGQRSCGFAGDQTENFVNIVPQREHYWILYFIMNATD